MKEKTKQRDRLFEWSVFFIALILSIIGIVSVYSAGSYTANVVDNNPFQYVIRQTLFLGISLVALLVCLSLKYKWFLDYKLQKRVIIGMVILLGILFVMPARNGAKGWISLGFFSLQPSEFAKLVLIWVTAMYFSVVRNLPNLDIPKSSGQLSYFWGQHHQEVALFLPYVAIIGLVVLQPDTGGAMIMLLNVVLLCLATGVVEAKKALKYLAIVGVVLLLLAGLAILILGTDDYRVVRLISFINPFSQANFANTYQVRNSFYALAHGGLFGVGIGNSIQKTGYLPENHTDFILSIIGEELGMIGALLVFGLIFVLIALIFRRSMTMKKPFDRFVLIGIGLMFLIQTLFNVGGITSIVPLTGVTLPFISYGGSSMLVSFIAIGIVLKLSIYDRSNHSKAEEKEVKKVLKNNQKPLF